MPARVVRRCAFGALPLATCQVSVDASGLHWASLSLNNTGPVASEEVVIGFVTLTKPDPQWAYLSPPNRNTAFFTRVPSVAVGASVPVTAALDSDALSVVDGSGARVFPTGVFTLTAGAAVTSFTVV